MRNLTQQFAKKSESSIPLSKLDVEHVYRHRYTFAVG